MTIVRVADTPESNVKNLYLHSFCRMVGDGLPCLDYYSKFIGPRISIKARENAHL